MKRETLIKAVVLICVLMLTGITVHQLTEGDNQAIDCVEVER